MFPIIGGRRVEQLKANVEALSLELSEEDVAEIEKGYDFELGFPHSFLSVTGKAPTGPQDIGIIRGLGYFDYVAPQTATKPHTGAIDAVWKP